MNGAALLAHQLRVVHLVVAQNLEGMSAEDALLQPPGGGNCANWILGAPGERPQRPCPGPGGGAVAQRTEAASRDAEGWV